MLILAPLYKTLGEKISRITNLPFENIVVKKFPDGETYIRMDYDVNGEEIFLLHPMFPNQNERLTEFLLMVDTLKDLNADKIVGVVPYLPYARQDKRFQPGEALSIKTLAKLFKSVGLDELITVDTHFHRKPEEFDYHGISCTNLSAGPSLLQYVKENITQDFIVIGPDLGSSKMIEFVTGKKVVFEKKKICSVCNQIMMKCKCKEEDKKIKYEVIELKSDYQNFTQKNVVVLDDIISSGSTMINAVNKLRKENVKLIVVAATHGLFLGNSLKILRKKADFVVVTDSINTPVSKVSLAPLIAKVIKR